LKVWLNAAGSEENREIAMRRVLRFLLWGLIVVVAVGGALFVYFVYSGGSTTVRQADRGDH